MFERRFESRQERDARLKRERAAAEKLAEPTPLHPTGAMWSDIRASFPDIPEETLALLLSLIIDFWWGGDVEAKNEGGSQNETVYVGLGTKHRTSCLAEQCRTEPAQYIITVHGHDFLAVDEDMTETPNGYLRERQLVEVGICPQAQWGEWYYDRDMRKSEGYRSVLALPTNDGRWKPPPRPNELFEGPLYDAYDRGGRAGIEAYEARVAEIERGEIETRIRLILGQAWKLQYLLRIWCGFNLDEQLWQNTIDQIIAIPTTPKSGQTPRQAISLTEAAKKFASNRTTASYDDSFFSNLQIMIILQLADRQRKGDDSPLVDPLNPKGQGFIAALNQFKDLPGLRRSLDKLRTLDKPSHSHARPPREDNWDY